MNCVHWLNSTNGAEDKAAQTTCLISTLLQWAWLLMTYWLIKLQITAVMQVWKTSRGGYVRYSNEHCVCTAHECVHVCAQQLSREIRAGLLKKIKITLIHTNSTNQVLYATDNETCHNIYLNPAKYKNKTTLNYLTVQRDATIDKWTDTYKFKISGSYIV